MLLFLFVFFCGGWGVPGRGAGETVTEIQYFIFVVLPNLE